MLFRFTNFDVFFSALGHKRRHQNVFLALFAKQGCFNVFYLYSCSFGCPPSFKMASDSPTVRVMQPKLPCIICILVFGHSNINKHTHNTNRDNNHSTPPQPQHSQQQHRCTATTPHLSSTATTLSSPPLPPRAGPACLLVSRSSRAGNCCLNAIQSIQYIGGHISGAYAQQRAGRDLCVAKSCFLDVFSKSGGPF